MTSLATKTPTGLPTDRTTSSARWRPVRTVLWRVLVALVWAGAAFDLLVLLWIVLSSLKTSNEIFSHPFNLPVQWRWSNFAAAWTDSNLGPAMFNTILLVAGTAITTVALAAPAAYALSRFGVRGSKSTMMYFALGIGIPVQVIMLPLYSMMNQVGLVDSLTGLWILYVATSLPFAVFFLSGFFSSLPQEVEEAAALDGASPNRTFWRIMLPLAQSGLVTLLILNVITHWSETVLALVFIQSTDHETLSLALLKFLQQLQYTGADWGQLFAGVVIVTLPVLLIYVWLGRHIVQGLTLGAGK